MNIIFQNTILVELIMSNAAAAAGNQFYFQDVPMLRGKKVYGVIAHLSGVDLTISTQGNPVVDSAEARVSLLTLANTQSGYPNYQLPVYELNPTQNGGFVRQFADLPIDITKSYVQITAASTLVTNDTWAFTFIYR